MTPDNFPGFNIALNVVTFIATLVGFLVIFLSMYTAILERTREIGILKSMGASKTSIVSMVLRESVLMSIVGIALGMALTYSIQVWLTHRFPTISLKSHEVGSLSRPSSPSWAQSWAQPIPPSWQHAKTPSTRSPTNK